MRTNKAKLDPRTEGLNPHFETTTFSMQITSTLSLRSSRDTRQLVRVAVKAAPYYQSHKTYSNRYAPKSLISFYERSQNILLVRLLNYIISLFTNFNVQ